ncbi:hypothetical protein NC651_039190 [Populus alba x Populus x berolinensis]|nr:hypothetical protein NC651_039190 [Populus alba x Populus x berolinensis]
MVPNPCLLLLLQLLLRIEAAKRGKEKERLTWSCYLKTKTVCIWLVGSTTYGEGKLKFPFAGGRTQVSLSSLCLCFFPPASSSLCCGLVFIGKRMPLHHSRDSVEITTVLSLLDC